MKLLDGARDIIGGTITEPRCCGLSLVVHRHVYTVTSVKQHLLTTTLHRLIIFMVTLANNATISHASSQTYYYRVTLFPPSSLHSFIPYSFRLPESHNGLGHHHKPSNSKDDKRPPPTEHLVHIRYHPPQGTTYNIHMWYINARG